MALALEEMILRRSMRQDPGQTIPAALRLCVRCQWIPRQAPSLSAGDGRYLG